MSASWSVGAQRRDRVVDPARRQAGVVLIAMSPTHCSVIGVRVVAPVRRVASAWWAACGPGRGGGRRRLIGSRAGGQRDRQVQDSRRRGDQRRDPRCPSSSCASARSGWLCRDHVVGTSILAPGDAQARLSGAQRSMRRFAVASCAGIRSAREISATAGRDRARHRRRYRPAGRSASSGTWRPTVHPSSAPPVRSAACGWSRSPCRRTRRSPGADEDRAVIAQLLEVPGRRDRYAPPGARGRARRPRARASSGEPMTTAAPWSRQAARGISSPPTAARASSRR